MVNKKKVRKIRRVKRRENNKVNLRLIAAMNKCDIQRGIVTNILRNFYLVRSYTLTFVAY